MTTSSDGPSGEPQNDAADCGPLEREIRDHFRRVARENGPPIEPPPEPGPMTRILIAQTHAIYRVARAVDDLNAPTSRR
jgi:hypothetical protein